MIIDVNGLKYVGKTSKTLNSRLNQHLYDKKKRNHCSSKELDLDNCEIILIQECSEEDSKEREYFWITGLTCVNKNNRSLNKKEWSRLDRIKNKERYIENRQKNKEKKRLYDQKRRTKH